MLDAPPFAPLAEEQDHKEDRQQQAEKDGDSEDFHEV